MLLEEFKGCLSVEIKIHLDERKAEDLHQATIWADDYALTHKGVFKQVQYGQVDTANKASGEHQLVPRKQTTSRANLPSLPPGPVCLYCKRRGHVKA